MNELFKANNFKVLQICNYTYIMPYLDQEKGLDLKRDIIVCIHAETKNISAHLID